MVDTLLSYFDISLGEKIFDMLPIYGVGIIGTGFGATGHIPVFNTHPQTKVVAICGRNKKKVQNLARVHNIPRAFTDYRQLIGNNEVDIVSVVTPNDSHSKIAQAALLAGKHTLCEKPMTTSYAEGIKLVEVAKRFKLIHGVNFIWRYTSQRQKIKQLIEDGFIGQVFTAKVMGFSNFIAAPPTFSWQDLKSCGGGTLSAWGSHIIDTFLWWLGDIESVMCNLNTFAPYRQSLGKNTYLKSETDDTVSFIIRFVKGADLIGQFSMASNELTPNRHFAIRGSKGTIILDKNNNLIVTDVKGRYYDVDISKPMYSQIDGPYADIILNHRLLPQFYSLVHNFVLSINTGSQFTPNFKDGLRVDKVIEALRNAALSNRAIKL